MAAWQYDTDAVDGGQRVRVSVHSMLPLDVDGRGLKPARLAFEDHPVWGYDCALELGGGDFECPVGCSVQVSIDGATPFEVLASRPQDADPPRLSLRASNPHAAAFWEACGFRPDSGGTRRSHLLTR